jgi:Co/Zn/Cd efflux system component
MHPHSHAHGADHDHEHAHSHAHGHAHVANERSVALAAALTGVFMIAEIVGGVLSGSLALLADAGHMLTDFASLSLAWLGFRLARQPADWRRTYGFDRFSVLVAFVNGIALFAIAAWIVLEASRRLYAPVQVVGGLMFWIASAGLAVNVIVFAILRTGDEHNLNIRAAILHVVGDLLGSVAAVVASIVIYLTGWMPIDALLSIVVALMAHRGRERPHSARGLAPGLRRARAQGRPARRAAVRHRRAPRARLVDQRGAADGHAARERCGRHELVHGGARDQADARAALSHHARHRRDRVRRLRRRPRPRDLLSRGRPPRVPLP